MIHDCPFSHSYRSDRLRVDAKNNARAAAQRRAWWQWQHTHCKRQSNAKLTRLCALQKLKFYFGTGTLCSISFMRNEQDLFLITNNFHNHSVVESHHANHATMQQAIVPLALAFASLALMSYDIWELEHSIIKPKLDNKILSRLFYT